MTSEVPPHGRWFGAIVVRRFWSNRHLRGRADNHRRGLRLAACGLLVACAGCSGWRHGTTLAQYQGLFLSAVPPSAGAERLRIEAAYDPTLRDFVAQHGPP